MAWTAPMTAVAGAVFTAAQFNTFVRDNMAETAPAKALTSSGYFVTSDTNQISERRITQAFVGASESTSSTTYDDLPTIGPSVTVTTGIGALVCVSGRIGPNSTSNASVKMSWEVSGASVIAATDNYAAGIVGVGTTGVAYTSTKAFHLNLTPGVNTFTAKYAVSAGTGTYQYRRITVMPF